MKAAQFTRYGGQEVVGAARNAPDPKPGVGQILVEVRGARSRGRAGVERTFTLGQATEAFHYFESGNPRGKVVVTV